jgi:hypothetical protein
MLNIGGRTLQKGEKPSLIFHERWRLAATFYQTAFLIDIKRPLNHNRMNRTVEEFIMQRTEAIGGEKFLDVIKKIEGMTSSQQRFIQEMLSQRKQAPALPNKRIQKRASDCGRIAGTSKAARIM